MAFLGKGLKVDLQVMATEMGVEDVLGLKVGELRAAILNSKDFDEEFSREYLSTIIEERKRKEGMELEERKRRDEMDFELQKKRIELKEENENEVLVEKLDEYEDVRGKTKRPAVPFISKEKSYRKTIPLNTRGSPSQLEDRDVRNKEGMANRKYVNHSNENSHQAHYNQNRITPRCYTCGKEGHFARACQDKSVNKQNSQKNKFSPAKAQSNIVQAEDATKNIMTARIDAPESACNFLAEDIDRLKIIRVKCLNVVLDGTVDSGAQISVVRADLVKDIESTGEGKINPNYICRFTETSERHDSYQTAYEALLESEQLCSVNARLVIDDETQLDENKKSIVCEVQTLEEGSCPDIEGSIDAGNIENVVRSYLNRETRLKADEEAKTVEEGRKVEEERGKN
ncbi:CCHC-type domain-containing protein [Trichonephila inaurata madagascariensis]|uniref:CCHC-type domain-containing protein n=1 Tax=Trichonephila inaurata madagascariensis TaxID=2747483 RepID=A0A8X7BVF9_9ARAC|nr:CCHC-type domain-containing protein [Trichonephila inaurata madagascariensis]